MIRRQPRLLAAAVLVAVVAVGCTSANKAIKADQQTSTRILTNFEKNQPTPERPWSQLRQNLIELEVAQSDTTQTTTFFFNQGTPEPIQSCPSIGFPIASTAQITNPSQVVRASSGGDHQVIPQIDPNGIYAGDSSGTYVICIDAQGKAYADYWEGFVQTVTGPAHWNTTTHQVELVGPPSFNFSEKKKP